MSITGYTVEEILGVIEAAVRRVHIYHPIPDSVQQREERHNGGDYIIDFMRQTRYEMETDLLAYEATAALLTPHDRIGLKRVPRTEGIRQRTREYEPVKGKKPLGEGAFGIVFEVTEKGTQQTHAQKQSKHANMQFTLLREVAIMKYLTDLVTPHVAPLQDVTPDKGMEQVSIIMPLYSDSLADQCFRKPRKKFNPLSPVKIRSFSRQLITGIRHCHAAGIVHQDLKPENILVQTKEAEDQLFIADLGMCRNISHRCFPSSSGTQLQLRI